MAIETFELVTSNGVIPAQLYSFIVACSLATSFVTCLAAALEYTSKRFGNMKRLVIASVLSLAAFSVMFVTPRFAPALTPYVTDRGQGREVNAVVAMEHELGGRWKAVDVNDHRLADAGISEDRIDFAGQLSDRLCAARFIGHDRVSLRCVHVSQ